MGLEKNVKQVIFCKNRRRGLEFHLNSFPRRIKELGQEKKTSLSFNKVQVRKWRFKEELEALAMEIWILFGEGTRNQTMRC